MYGFRFDPWVLHLTGKSAALSFDVGLAGSSCAVLHVRSLSSIVLGYKFLIPAKRMFSCFISLGIFFDPGFGSSFLFAFKSLGIDFLFGVERPLLRGKPQEMVLARFS